MYRCLQSLFVNEKNKISRKLVIGDSNLSCDNLTRSYSFLALLINWDNSLSTVLVIKNSSHLVHHRLICDILEVNINHNHILRGSLDNRFNLEGNLKKLSLVCNYMIISKHLCCHNNR